MFYKCLHLVLKVLYVKKENTWRNRETSHHLFFFLPFWPRTPHGSWTSCEPWTPRTANYLPTLDREPLANREPIDLISSECVHCRRLLGIYTNVIDLFLILHFWPWTSRILSQVSSFNPSIFLEYYLNLQDISSFHLHSSDF